MDWRNRKYYWVRFAPYAGEFRIEQMKDIEGIKFSSHKDVPKQKDESEVRGYYQYLIGVKEEWADAVEFELRRASTRDAYCKWGEIKKA